MSIELMVNCDECRNRLSEGDEVFCESCYSGAEKEISRLEERISQLEDEIAELENA